MNKQYYETLNMIESKLLKSLDVINNARANSLETKEFYVSKDNLSKLSNNYWNLAYQLNDLKELIQWIELKAK